MLIMFKTFCAKHAIFDLNMKILNDCIDVFLLSKSQSAANQCLVCLICSALY